MRVLRIIISLFLLLLAVYLMSSGASPVLSLVLIAAALFVLLYRGIAAQDGSTPSAPVVMGGDVQFTVYRPGCVRPDRWYTMLVFAHLSEQPPGADGDEPHPIDEVERQANLILDRQAGGHRALTEDSGKPVPPGSHLRFEPVMEGFEFNPKQRVITWSESIHREEFRLRAAPDLVGKTARGHVKIWLGILLLAEVNISIRVSTAEKPAKPSPARASRYRKIFASYSHKDAGIVDTVQQIVSACGDDFLRDTTDLRSGQVWNDELKRLIDQADVFQLFWSSNSMTSPYVRQEWEYALSLGRPRFVRPVYWEDPMPTTKELPPPSLRRLHFERLTAPAPTVPAAPQPARVQASPLLRRILHKSVTLGVVLAAVLGVFSWHLFSLNGEMGGPPEETVASSRDVQDEWSHDEVSEAPADTPTDEPPPARDEPSTPPARSPADESPSARDEATSTPPPRSPARLPRSEPPPVEAPPQDVPTIDRALGGYTLIVYAAPVRSAAVAEAQKYRLRFRDLAIPLDVLESEPSGSIRWYRVAVGQVATQEEAVALRNRLSHHLPQNTRVTRITQD